MPRLLASAVLIAACAVLQASAELPSATDLLPRAAGYVGRFERSMSTVVLEERYVQIIKHWIGAPKQPDRPRLTWIDDWSTERRDVSVIERRQTRADMLLVQLPDQRWTAFRDTFEVNGYPRGNREDRLRSLFVTQTEESRRQLRRINEESATYNLGGFYRELNLPTIGLIAFHPSHQQRFAFQPGAAEHAGPVPCRSIAFVEKTRPTLVQSLRKYDVPLRGRACVDDSGTVWKTRVDLDPRYTMRGAIEVTYGRDERVNVLVPVSMWEWYVLPQGDRDGSLIFLEALAQYSNMRQFTVTTSEQVK